MVNNPARGLKEECGHRCEVAGRDARPGNGGKRTSVYPKTHLACEFLTDNDAPPRHFSDEMKVLFNCHVPFALAHGGVQIQIEQTKAALKENGVSVDPLRWWDETQQAEIIHHFGRVPTFLLHLANQKGIKVIFSDLLGGLGARSRGKVWLQRTLTRTLRHTLPRSIIGALNWESYRLADACLALTPWEAHLMSYVFGAQPGKVRVVPNGVEDVFLNSPRRERGPWLVCVATIAKVKRVLELAEAALRSQTPLWIIGKAYSDSDPYAQEFFALARRHATMIRYEGPIEDRTRLAEVYREARGFVLLSAWESLSLSALEAAACECPLLLTDLPWARTTFGTQASYCPYTSVQRTAKQLRSFYDHAPQLPQPPKPLRWSEVAQLLKGIYDQVLKQG